MNATASRTASVVKMVALATAALGGFAASALMIPPAGRAGTIAPAAATSTAHYQTYFDLTCSASSCSGDFPEAGRNHRLNITRVTCAINAGTDTTSNPNFADLELFDKDDHFVTVHWLPWDSSGLTAHYLNSAVDVQVEAGERLHVRLGLFNALASTANCSAFGTRTKLG
jgi:hypothetical protein